MQSGNIQLTSLLKPAPTKATPLQPLNGSSGASLGASVGASVGVSSDANGFADWMRDAANRPANISRSNNEVLPQNGSDLPTSKSSDTPKSDAIASKTSTAESQKPDIDKSSSSQAQPEAKNVESTNGNDAAKATGQPDSAAASNKATVEQDRAQQDSADNDSKTSVDERQADQTDVSSTDKGSSQSQLAAGDLSASQSNNNEGEANKNVQTITGAAVTDSEPSANPEMRVKGGLSANDEPAVSKEPLANKDLSASGVSASTVDSGTLATANQQQAANQAASLTDLNSASAKNADTATGDSSNATPVQARAADSAQPPLPAAAAMQAELATVTQDAKTPPQNSSGAAVGVAQSDGAPIELELPAQSAEKAAPLAALASSSGSATNEVQAQPQWLTASSEESASNFQSVPDLAKAQATSKASEVAGRVFPSSSSESNTASNERLIDEVTDKAATVSVSALGAESRPTQASSSVSVDASGDGRAATVLNAGVNSGANAGAGGNNSGQGGQQSGSEGQMGRQALAEHLAQAAQQSDKSADARVKSESAEAQVNATRSLATGLAAMDSSVRPQASALAAVAPAALNRMQQAQWGQKLGERSLMMVQHGPRVAFIQLDPPELGALQLRVQIQAGDQVSVSITAPNAAVKDVLEQHMPRLREMFAEQGLNLSQSDVRDQSAGKGGDSSGDDSYKGGGQYADGNDESEPEFENKRVAVGLVNHYV